MRLVSLVLAFLLLAPAGQAQAPAPQAASREAARQSYERLALLGEVIDRIRAEYVDTPDEASLIEAAIRGMLGALDEYSQRLDRQQAREMQQQARGQFGGLGIEVTQREGRTIVVAPIDDSPAARAGLVSGDVITHADGVALQDMPLPQVIERLRGDVGTEIRITVVSDGGQPRDVVLRRALINPRIVVSRREDDVAYVRLTFFNQRSAADVRQAVERLLADIGPGARGIVLDLRNNPGGLLDEAGRVADLFLETGTITYTRVRGGAEGQRLRATPGDVARGLPMAVLINGGTASAAEIVAGALQDHGRARIVGTTSFGKGSVQTVSPLRDGGALRLTTARYYTPNGRMIHDTGIVPDVEVASPEPPRPDGAPQASAPSAGTPADDARPRRRGSPIPAETKDDPQLLRALETVRQARTAAQ
jgi:carboxyl-terminal processing protease